MHATSETTLTSLHHADLSFLHISRADLTPSLHLPRRLTTLSLPATSAPPATDPVLGALLSLNAKTLTSLRFHLNLRRLSALDSMLPALLVVAPSLRHLRVFCLPGFARLGESCPTSLVALLEACDSLEHLELAKLPVEYLLPLLSALSKDVTLRRLETNLPGASATGAEHESASDRAKVLSQAMSKVAALKALQSLQTWTVTRRETQWETEEGWRRARVALEGGGCRVELCFEQ